MREVKRGEEGLLVREEGEEGGKGARMRSDENNQ